MMARRTRLPRGTTSAVPSVPALAVLAAVGAAVGVAVSLAGCAGESGASSSPSTTQSSAQASATASQRGSDPGSAPRTTPRGEAPSASVATRSLPPVVTGKPAALAPGVTVVLSTVRAIHLTGSAPGEVSGPGAEAHLTVRNTTGKAFDLDSIAVTASYGSGQPAAPSSGPTTRELTGSLAPGRTAQGVYLFRVPASGLASLRLEVSSGDAPDVAVFQH